MDTVKRSNIRNCPKDATLTLYNPSGEFIQLFYKYIDITYNDKSTAKVLQYLSEFGLWQGSTSKNIEDNPQFKLIID